ncbi:tyrosine-type recombinase/integrase [Acidimangrovimonas pyrenivorans]|uniref:Tyrosine-type recombinase/integrase n=1 Tax=Acidimangrovimonas pyrenivorans TaxID=2030798 RepID=A0ABV7AD85_9RHOB
MAKSNKVKLTREAIRTIDPPEKGEFTLWDTEVLGLGVRCLPSGAKSYIVVYRAGRGRAGTPRRMTLGRVEGLRLEDARKAALRIRGEVLHGADPVAEQRAARREKKRQPIKLSEAIARYDKDQERRKVANRAKVQSSLKRHLLDQIGDMPLIDVDRRAVIEAMEAVEAGDGPGLDKPLPGAAASMRSYASTFLKWCADRGLIPANPLQGYKAPRATRAQRIARPGRSLSDAELARAWAACEGPKVHPVFGACVRVLLLTGQRRTETARMRWADLSEDRTVWRIPETETKNGFAHDVPLPALARDVIASVQPLADCEFVFSTTGTTPISGWSKANKALFSAFAILTEAEAVPAGQPLPAVAWTLHDLRRTFRSGLTRLGVDQDVAEIMLNHRPETLRSIYDRDPRMGERRDAAERWANHVAAIINPEGQRNVVQLREVY